MLSHAAGIQDPADLCLALLPEWVALAACERARVILNLGGQPYGPADAGAESNWLEAAYPTVAPIAPPASRPMDAPTPPWSWPLLSEVLGPALAAGEAVVVDTSRAHAMSVLRWPAGQPLPRRCVVRALLYGGEVVGLLMLADYRDDQAHNLVNTAWRPALDATAAALGAVRARTQRDAAQRALHESDEGYRAIFDTAAAGIARMTPVARLLDANPRFCEIVGRSWAELKGRSILDLTHPDDIAPDLALLDSALAGKTPGSRYAREKRYVRPDGSIVWAAVSGVVVRDASGRPSHLISVIEDITERKRYHDALSAVQAAERANRAKSEFLSRMSHELRTPLNAMLGFAQLLRVDASQPLSITQRTKVEHIERAGAHLLAMINDVLDLSRIEAGGLSLSLETLRVSSVVEDALEFIAAIARGADVHLRYDPPTTGFFVKADRVRLRQVLINLLSNAIKYNYPGGNVQIAVNAASGPQGRHMQIAVSDTGMGLTPEQQSRLFEPFNRLGAERGGIEGTGIGLVVVKRLIELMQGGIAVESRPGRGTTFTVWVPQVDAPAAPSGSGGRGQAGWRASALGTPGTLGLEETDPEEFLTSPMPLEEPAEEVAQMFTVLYAEDNEVNVELVRQVMRMRPTYRLLVAHSGAQAIELARSQRPHVLLLDMHLGDMTGLDVVAVLDREPHTAGIPRIALSADAMPDQIRAARERGFRIYLTKPLDVGALLRALDEHAQSAIQPVP